MYDDINLKINDFDGPLDLLLELVRDKQMDILEIDLVQLATQYIEIIDKLKDRNIDLASEYLLMASTLLQIKSKGVLDGPKAVQESKEAKDILKQLAEYQQFKKISEALRTKEAQRSSFYIKKPSDYSPFQPKIDESRLDGSSDAIKLIMSLRKMFERTYAEKYRQATIEAFNLSPADRRLELIKIMETKEDLKFEDFFSVPSMNHFVITVLTVLDMARKGELILSQDEQYGEIKIEKGIIRK